MSRDEYGFYTGRIEIKPYLSRDDVAEDCKAGLVRDAFRKSDISNWIIPKTSVEEYYQSKNLPPVIIKQKLAELGIQNVEHQREVITGLVRNAQPYQLSLIQSLARP